LAGSKPSIQITANTISFLIANHFSGIMIAKIKLI